MEIEVYELKLIGKTYEIDKNILMKIPIIKTMLVDFPDNKSKIISLNRSSLLFDHVIAYIIDDTYPYPLKYFTELDYYDIIYDKNKLYNPHKNSNDKLEIISKNTTEINALTNKIYELENRIENITYNTAIYIDINSKCKYQSCKINPGLSTFCTEHKKLFVNKCGYKNPNNQQYCDNTTNENCKYCMEHLAYATFCNDKYCRYIRIKTSKFCFMHHK